VTVKWTPFVVGLLLFTSRASAELSTLREHARQMDSKKLALGGEMSTFFGHVDDAGYALVQPSALAFARLGEAVLELFMPFTYVHENNDPGSDHNLFGVANPWFGLSYLPDTSCGLARLSIGIAPDLADASTPRKARVLALARGAQGGADAYLFADRFLPLVFGGGTLKDVSFLRLAWDADAVVGLPLAARDVEFGVQTAGELALRFAWHTQVGVRGLLAYYPTLPGDDFQSSLALFARHTRVRGDSFAARFVANLDPPAGLSFTRDGMWGLSFFYATPL
jgi:hypothetical protein